MKKLLIVSLALLISGCVQYVGPAPVVYTAPVVVRTAPVYYTPYYYGPYYYSRYYYY